MPENNVSIGNSNRIARAYLDSLMIETRYLDSVTPDISFELYGCRAASPIMTAALSHLDHFMFEGAAMALAEGAKAADAIMWYGMASDEEIEALAGTGVKLIEIIKPYEDREKIYGKIRHAEELGLVAVGVDIDHPFANDGTKDIVDGEPMRAMTTVELTQLCTAAKLPLIVKGVLSARDAARSQAAGVRGMVLSHHNNRIEYALPPAMLLPEVSKQTAGQVPLFVDCEVKTGMDAFKCLSLGAKGVCIGRPLMAAIRQGGADAVRDYLLDCNRALAKAMAYTGCADLGHMDPSVIHRI